MSISVRILEIPEHLRDRIITDLQFRATPTKYKKNRHNNSYAPRPGKEVIAYRVVSGNDDDDRGETVAMPFHYTRTVLGLQSPPDRGVFQGIIEDRSVYAHLRPAQADMMGRVLCQMGKTHTALLGLHVGFGKSLLSIAIANKTRLKTMIITHRVLLSTQWKESIEKWSPRHTVVVFDPRASKNDDALSRVSDCDFLVCSVLNVEKVPASILRTIGFVVVDECHLISTECFSRSLHYLFPRYLVGLSATPYRSDGMDRLLELYFGETTAFVVPLKMAHVVYKVQTSFEPRIVLNRNGEMDWCSILDQQSRHEARNRMIVRICALFDDRKILVLCKRVQQATVLYEMARVSGIRATHLLGGASDFDKDADVLIATVQKAGVGFSHDILDMLVLASDVEEYYIQYLGRVTRRPDVAPVVVDIVDKNNVLQKHFRTRKKVYEEIGGVIRDFHTAFPGIDVI